MNQILPSVESFSCEDARPWFTNTEGFDADPGAGLQGESSAADFGNVFNHAPATTNSDVVSLRLDANERLDASVIGPPSTPDGAAAKQPWWSRLFRCRIDLPNLGAGSNHPRTGSAVSGLLLSLEPMQPVGTAPSSQPLPNAIQTDHEATVTTPMQYAELRKDVDDNAVDAGLAKETANGFEDQDAGATTGEEDDCLGEMRARAWCMADRYAGGLRKVYDAHAQWRRRHNALMRQKTSAASHDSQHARHPASSSCCTSSCPTPAGISSTRRGAITKVGGIKLGREPPSAVHERTRARHLQFKSGLASADDTGCATSDQDDCESGVGMQSQSSSGNGEPPRIEKRIALKRVRTPCIELPDDNKLRRNSGVASAVSPSKNEFVGFQVEEDTAESANHGDPDSFLNLLNTSRPSLLKKTFQGRSRRTQTGIRWKNEADITLLAKKYRFRVTEVQDCLREFDALDTEGRGVLLRSEFLEVVCNRLCLKDANEIPQRVLDEVWRTTDSDESGEIDFEEFLAWTQTVAFSDDMKIELPGQKQNRMLARQHNLPVTTIEVVRREYDRIQSSPDGTIDKNCFATLVQALLQAKDQADIPPGRLDRFWIAAAGSVNGSLCFTQFLDWYVKYFVLGGEMAGPSSYESPACKMYAKLGVDRLQSYFQNLAAPSSNTEEQACEDDGAKEFSSTPKASYSAPCGTPCNESPCITRTPSVCFDCV